MTPREPARGVRSELAVELPVAPKEADPAAPKEADALLSATTVRLVPCDGSAPGAVCTGIGGATALPYGRILMACATCGAGTDARAEGPPDEVAMGVGNVEAALTVFPGAPIPLILAIATKDPVGFSPRRPGGAGGEIERLCRSGDARGYGAYGLDTVITAAACPDCPSRGLTFAFDTPPGDCMRTTGL